MNDPGKWVDDEDTTTEERSLLRAGRAMDLEKAARDRNWALLVARLPPPGGGDGGAGASGAAAAAGGAAAGGARLLSWGTGTAIVAGALGTLAIVAHGKWTTPVERAPAGVVSVAEQLSPPPRPAARDNPTDETTNVVPAPDASQLPPPARPPSAEARPPSTRGPTPVASVADTEASSPPPVLTASAPPVVEPSPSASAPASRATRLADELRLVRDAREALRSGRHAKALALLDDAHRQFPGGVLGEEREMLVAQALAGSGRREEARVHAAAFLRAHPKSAYAAAMRELETN